MARVVCLGRALAFDVGFAAFDGAAFVVSARGDDAAFGGHWGAGAGAAFVLLARGVDAAFGELWGAGDGAALGGPWGGGGAEETSVVLPGVNDEGAGSRDCWSGAGSRGVSDEGAGSRDCWSGAGSRGGGGAACVGICVAAP